MFVGKSYTVYLGRLALFWQNPKLFLYNFICTTYT